MIAAVLWKRMYQGIEVYKVLDSKRIRHITGASDEKIEYMLTKVEQFTLEMASTKLAGLRGLWM